MLVDSWLVSVVLFSASTLTDMLNFYQYQEINHINQYLMHLRSCHANKCAAMVADAISAALGIYAAHRSRVLLRHRHLPYETAILGLD